MTDRSLGQTSPPSPIPDLQVINFNWLLKRNSWEFKNIAELLVYHILGSKTCRYYLIDSYINFSSIRSKKMSASEKERLVVLFDYFLHRPITYITTTAIRSMLLRFQDNHCFQTCVTNTTLAFCTHTRTYLPTCLLRTVVIQITRQFKSKLTNTRQITL